MGKFSPHWPHRSQPLMISPEWSDWLDVDSRIRVSSRFPPHGQIKSSKRVNFIEVPDG
jgi:hypothetical protein